MPEQLELFASCVDCGCEDCDNVNRHGEPQCGDHGEQVGICENCSRETDRERMTTAQDGNDYCHDCYCELYTCCDGCGDEVDADNAHFPDDGNGPYCESCYDSRYTTCADCSETFRNPGRYGSTYRNCNDEPICESCAESYGSCDECGNICLREDMIYRDSREHDYCCDCDPGEHEGDFEAVHFDPDNLTFDIIGSERTFGVELETSECPDYMDLEGRVYFGACEDGSIEGKEFVSAVLKGDEGLAAITEFCRLANGFAVDNTCGFHAHFGMSDLTDEQKYAVCMAYLLCERVWQSFVPDNRRRNTYCESLKFSAHKIEDYAERGESYSSFASYESGNRYRWLNLQAYGEHRTFEIRLHTATLNPEKINNWIVAHCRFIDAVATMTVAEVARFFRGNDEDRFAALCELWRDERIAEYYRERAEKFGTTYREPVGLPCGIA